MTNYEKIKAMSIEEMEKFLCSITDCTVCVWGTISGCNLKNWLESEAEDNG